MRKDDRIDVVPPRRGRLRPKAIFMTLEAGALNVSRQTLQDNVYELLKGALMAGEFVPGQAVTIRELKELVGTSAMPIREATRRLLAERALEASPNGTMRVCNLSREEREEVMEIRIALESMAAHRAAARISRADIARLNSLNREIKAALRQGEAKLAALKNQEFHFDLYRIADSCNLMSIIESLWMQSGPYLHRYLQRYLAHGGRTRHDTLRYHGELLGALRAGDGEAAAAAICGDLSHTAIFLDEIGEA